MNIPTQLPKDHRKRMQRALLSFDGLSIGDGFGEQCFIGSDTIERRLRTRTAPDAPWMVTDDTMMALSIVRCLKRHGFIEQEDLAQAFAHEYVHNPNRGYGGMAMQILAAIAKRVFVEGGGTKSIQWRGLMR